MYLVFTAALGLLCRLSVAAMSATLTTTSANAGRRRVYLHKSNYAVRLKNTLVCGRREVESCIRRIVDR